MTTSLEDELAEPGPILDKDYLIKQLRQSLQANIFTGRLRITPHRVNQVAAEVAVSFLEFRDREQEAAVYHYGERLAEEGVGHRAVLSLAETLRRVAWESSNAADSGDPAAGRYVFALLAGYMAGREAYLLAEQARAHRALERARERNGTEVP